jgi:hypothetical protein
MALIPILWLALQRERRRVWWWLACVFLVAWVADLASHWVDPWLIGTVYPFSQAALVAMILLEREAARFLIASLAVFALLIIAHNGVSGPDLLFRVLAWGSICLMARAAPPQVQVVLTISFGLGLIAWASYALQPGWATWGAYQGVRAVGIAVFCWGSQHRPELRAA